MRVSWSMCMKVPRSMCRKVSGSMDVVLRKTSLVKTFEQCITSLNYIFRFQNILPDFSVNFEAGTKMLSISESL